MPGLGRVSGQLRPLFDLPDFVSALERRDVDHALACSASDADVCVVDPNSPPPAARTMSGSPRIRVLARPPRGGRRRRLRPGPTAVIASPSRDAGGKPTGRPSWPEHPQAPGRAHRHPAHRRGLGARPPWPVHRLDASRRRPVDHGELSGDNLLPARSCGRFLVPAHPRVVYCDVDSSHRARPGRQRERRRRRRRRRRPASVLSARAAAATDARPPVSSGAARTGSRSPA